MTQEEFDETLADALRSGQVVAVYQGIRIMLIAREHLKPHHAALAPDEAIWRLQLEPERKSVMNKFDFTDDGNRRSAVAVILLSGIVLGIIVIFIVLLLSGALALPISEGMIP